MHAKCFEDWIRKGNQICPMCKAAAPYEDIAGDEKFWKAHDATEKYDPKTIEEIGGQEALDRMEQQSSQEDNDNRVDE